MPTFIQLVSVLVLLLLTLALTSSSAAVAATPTPGLDNTSDLSQVSESTTNIYSALRESARLSLFPDIPSSFCKQLWALAAVYAPACLVSLASLALAARKGKLHFVHRIESTRSVVDSGAFWVPSWTSIFPLCIALHSGLAQGYIASTLAIDRNKDHAAEAEDQVNYILWQTCIWLPLWFAGYSLVWHMVFTADTTRLASSHFVSSQDGPSQRTPGIVAFLPSPRVTNALLWSLPLVVALVTVIPFALANKAYNHLFYAWQSYDATAADAAEDFTGLVNPRINRRLANLMDIILDERDETVRLVRGGYIAYVFFGALLFLASFALLLVMSRVLDRQLRSLAAAAIREEAGEVARVAPSYAERHTAMKAYMRSFLLVAGSVFLVSGLYTGISLSIAIQPANPEAGDPKHATSSRILAGLWTFAVLGTCATAATLHQTCSANSTGSTAVRSPAQAQTQAGGPTVEMREATSALRGLRPLTVVLLGGNRVGLGSGKEGSIRLKRSDSFGSRSGYSTSALQKEAIMEMDENDGHRPGA